MGGPGGKNDGPKRGRKVRVDFRRNRQARTRQKYVPGHLARNAEDTDKLSTPTWETVSAKGDLSRKRTIVEREDAGAATAIDGVVVRVLGLMAEVDGPDGRRYLCTVRRILRTLHIGERHPVVVGDRVRFQASGTEGDSPREGSILSVLPRRTQLCRATEKKRHVIAANVDQLIVVASADAPPLKTSLIDRYLVSASAGMLPAVVCINKADLDIDGFTAEVLDRYRKIGYPALATSTITGAPD